MLYDSNGGPIWDSKTYNSPGSKLLVQDDGNAVIYSPDMRPIWATNTCCYR